MIDAEKELEKIAAAAKGGTKPGARRSASPKTAGETAGTPRKEAGAGGKESGTVVVRLVQSGICTPKDQKATLRGLGLRRIGQTVVRPDVPAVRGMVRKVRHLVVIEKN